MPRVLTKELMCWHFTVFCHFSEKINTKEHGLYFPHRVHRLYNVIEPKIGRVSLYKPLSTLLHKYTPVGIVTVYNLVTVYNFDDVIFSSKLELSYFLSKMLENRKL